MKTSVKFKTSIILVILSCWSCKQKSNKVIGYVDNTPITYNEVDSTISQQLYDALNNIYLIRKIALDDYISKKLINIEAKNKGVSEEDLLNSLYSLKMDSMSIINFAKKNKIDKRISEFKGEYKFYDTNTKIGQEVLNKKYKKMLAREFVDSLMRVHKINILLEKPLKPRINTNLFICHYRGNLKSKISFKVISDFDCDMCIKYHTLFDSIYAKYRSDIKFGYVNFGSYISPSIMASECANNQGKFWEFHNALYKLDHTPDFNDVLSIAQSLNLDLFKFKNDFNNKILIKKIETGLHDVLTSGIYGTPTILINDRPVFNSSSYKDIVKVLDEKLKKNDSK